MNLFLTKDELIELTGYKLPSGQVRWLHDNCIEHYVNRVGAPIVLRSIFLTTKTELTIHNQSEEPNFDAI